MEYFKVKVSYSLYTDLDDKKFAAYIKLMALTTQLEAIPTYEQMTKITHPAVIKALERHFKRQGTSLSEILSKVLQDVAKAHQKREQNKIKMQVFRGLKKDNITRGRNAQRRR